MYVHELKIWLKLFTMLKIISLQEKPKLHMLNILQKQPYSNDTWNCTWQILY